MTMLILSIITIVLAVWIYMDSKKRGMESARWVIGALLFSVLIVPLYLGARKKLPETS